MTRDLAERRAERDRIRRRRAHYWAGNASASARNYGTVLKTPHPCSSWCCGNQRTHFGMPTMQERRAFQESE